MQAGRLHPNEPYIFNERNWKSQIVTSNSRLLELSKSSNGKPIARLVYWCYGA